MNQHKKPQWWIKEYDSAWDRVRAAFKLDWDRMNHDFGGKTFEQLEDAYRFGHGAKAHYGSSFPNWDIDLEEVLENDWRETHPYFDWSSYRSEIRRGWEYERDEGMRKAA